MKKSYVIILIALFLAFLVHEVSKDADFEVLEVLSPTEITVDVNNNGIQDDDETFCLGSVQSFSTKPTEDQNKLAQKLKLSNEDSIGLGFLAQEFAKNRLVQHRVKLKYLENQPDACISSKIYVDNQDYQLLLLTSGLAYSSSFDNKDSLAKNVVKARKLNLKIFNNKSHKYHKLTCKYGRLAHNSQILPASQLPNDAKPCKFCLVAHKCDHRNHFVNVANFIPNVVKPSAVFANGFFKVILTDLTTVYKPSNTCNTQVCRALVQQINSAQSSIDFAIYGYTKIPQIQCALEQASKRGVKIRFVYDIDGKNQNIYPDTFYLTKVFTDNQADFDTARAKKCQNNLMHNKFFIFDNRLVMTGSANLSTTDYSGMNSNAVIFIDSPQLAQIYSKEFEQMYSHRFHTAKSKLFDKENIQLGDSSFSVYYSPADRPVTAQIIPLIDGAQKYIYMPVFLITHKGLTDSLIRAANRGVDVRVIVDATNASGSASNHKLLRANGILVKTENYAGKLHSKSIIIDDAYTVIGSMNFSRSGESVNDENMVIIKNRELAVFYKNFFKYLWARIPDKWLKLNARAESPDSVGSCSDGLDNDFDGKIDRLDSACAGVKR